jgi:hypothetical protein
VAARAWVYSSPAVAGARNVGSPIPFENFHAGPVNFLVLGRQPAFSGDNCREARNRVYLLVPRARKTGSRSNRERPEVLGSNTTCPLLAAALCKPLLFWAFNSSCDTKRFGCNDLQGPYSLCAMALPLLPCHVLTKVLYFFLGREMKKRITLSCS